MVELSTPDRSLVTTIEAAVGKVVVAPPEEGSGLLHLRLQFANTPPEQQERLGQLLLKLLQGPGGMRRAYPRISHRLVVNCAAAEDSRAIVRDISLGGAGMWMEHPLEVGEEVMLEMARRGKAPLSIPAVVVSFRPARDGEPYHFVGVKFSELEPHLKEEFRAFLFSLLSP
jgi:hypothetical protein